MFLSNQIAGPGSAGPGLTTVAGAGAMKSSIVLFDTAPGTRNWTAPTACTIRAFVVGGGGYNGGSGGGYSEYTLTVTAGQVISYTVGARGDSVTPTGGTSSFNSVISATGGAGSAGAVGTGSGGTVNTSGGLGAATGNIGGASGHRFGDGGAGIASGGGGGWSQAGTAACGGSAGVDGYGLGLVPGLGAVATPAGYGAGGFGSYPPGLGGGGAGTAAAIGGGGGSAVNGGRGLVGIEIIG